MKDRDDKNKRFESYPKPSESDNQLKNQTEFIDEFPNEKETDRDTKAPSTKVNLPKEEEKDNR